MKRSALHALAAKCKHFHKKQWCAYATPVEVLLLQESGAVLKPYYVTRATARKAEGDMQPTWVYFELVGGTPLSLAIGKQSKVLGVVRK